MSQQTLAEFSCLSVTLEQNIAHLQLTRPAELNSLNAQFWEEFPQALTTIAEHTSARVLVISSQGKHFSAGLDLALLRSLTREGEPGRAAEQLRRKILKMQAAFNQLEALPIPVLAAIQGGCVGAGVDLVCACDSRYATTEAFFTVKEIAVGMTADLGTLQRLPQLMPQGLARELAYTGRRFPAQQALAVGFINQSFASHQQLLEGVMAVAKQIASHSPLAITGTKEMLNYSRDHDTHDSLNYMATWQSGMLHSTDIVEAIDAASEQRAPEFLDLNDLNNLNSQGKPKPRSEP